MEVRPEVPDRLAERAEFARDGVRSAVDDEVIAQGLVGELVRVVVLLDDECGRPFDSTARASAGSVVDARSALRGPGGVLDDDALAHPLADEERSLPERLLGLPCAPFPIGRTSRRACPPVTNDEGLTDLELHRPVVPHGLRVGVVRVLLLDVAAEVPPRCRPEQRYPRPRARR